jgi:hypothetical protein
MLIRTTIRSFGQSLLFLYLNDVPADCGGATVFPLANAEARDPLLIAARRLMDDRISHTRGSAGSMGIMAPHEEDASLLERSVADRQRGLRIQPQAGRLCIFFRGRPTVKSIPDLGTEVSASGTMVGIPRRINTYLHSSKRFTTELPIRIRMIPRSRNTWLRRLLSSAWHFNVWLRLILATSFQPEAKL